MNEYSPYFSELEYICNINESSPEDIVFCPEILAIDNDYNDIIHYTILQENASPNTINISNYIRIASDGGIVLKKVFDYETDKHTYSFFIVVSIQINLAIYTFIAAYFHISLRSAFVLDLSAFLRKVLQNQLFKIVKLPSTSFVVIIINTFKLLVKTQQ